MNEKEKRAVEMLNKKQNKRNVFTNIGPVEIRREVKRMEREEEKKNG